MFAFFFSQKSLVDECSGLRRDLFCSGGIYELGRGVRGTAGMMEEEKYEQEGKGGANQRSRHRRIEEDEAEWKT